MAVFIFKLPPSCLKWPKKINWFARYRADRQTDGLTILIKGQNYVSPPLNKDISLACLFVRPVKGGEFEPH
jgi:hypothetical protein